MRGFTRAKYERVMDKLYLDRPMHTVDFVFRTTTATPHNVCTIKNVPCIIDVKSITSTYDKITSTYYTIKQIEVIVEKKYLEGKTFTDGVLLSIGTTLTNYTSNPIGSYPYAVLSTDTSTKIDLEGYTYSNIPIQFGEFLDGGYRNYIRYSCYKAETIV